MPHGPHRSLTLLRYHSWTYIKPGVLVFTSLQPVDNRSIVKLEGDSVTTRRVTGVILFPVSTSRPPGSGMDFHSMRRPGLCRFVQPRGKRGCYEWQDVGRY
jgi:hypothetical protein